MALPSIEQLLPPSTGKSTEGNEQRMLPLGGSQQEKNRRNIVYYHLSYVTSQCCTSESSPVALVGRCLKNELPGKAYLCPCSLWMGLYCSVLPFQQAKAWLICSLHCLYWESITRMWWHRRAARSSHLSAQNIESWQNICVSELNSG